MSSNSIVLFYQNCHNNVLKCFDFWLILGSHLAPSPLCELPLEAKLGQGENH